MQLYYHPASGNSRRVRLAAAVAGIDLDLVVVDLLRGENRAPSYLALNPNGAVPTLVDGNFVLWESNAIIHYLVAKVPGSPLLPRDAKGHADVLRWQFWGIAHWGKAIQPIVFERMVKPRLKAGPPDEKLIEQSLGDFHRYAAVLDGHLQARNYLVGPTLTIADISVAIALGFAAPAQIPYGNYANIARWFASIEGLDAWSSTAPVWG
jgi:glutathione S-transferase